MSSAGAQDSTAKADTSSKVKIDQAQAVRGLASFTKNCVECHTKADITGADFKIKWDGRPVWDLYDVIHTTMPDDKPGTLTVEEYIDVVAYLVRINGAQQGGVAFSPADTAGLKKMKMEIIVPAPFVDSVKVDGASLGGSRSTQQQIGINHLFTRQQPRQTRQLKF
ncbi:MAG: c-type cytochrome [Gemmatimonas sp.]